MDGPLKIHIKFFFQDHQNGIWVAKRGAIFHRNGQVLGAWSPMFIGACANGLWACTDSIHFAVRDAHEIQNSCTEAFDLLKVGFSFLDYGECKANLKEQKPIDKDPKKYRWHPTFRGLWKPQRCVYLLFVRTQMTCCPAVLPINCHKETSSLS